MKQILLAVILIFTIGFKSWSQCTPTWPTGGGHGISPNDSVNLPHALAGMQYDATVQFFTPSDTTAVIFGVPTDLTINTIHIMSVEGLNAIPSSSAFTYSTNPSGGAFPGNSVGCIQITGTPAASGSAGTYPLKVHVSIDVTLQPLGTVVNGLPDSIVFYKIVVDPNTSVPSISNSKFDLSQNFPNPFNYKTNISFNMPVKSYATFKIFDLIGNVVYEKYIDAKIGINTINIDASDLKEGVYFYSVSSSAGSLTRRLIIDRK